MYICVYICLCACIYAYIQAICLINYVFYYLKNICVFGGTPFPFLALFSKLEKVFTLKVSPERYVSSARGLQQVMRLGYLHLYSAQYPQYYCTGK